LTARPLDVTRAAARQWWPVGLLGLSSVGAYGLVLYAYSALIAPIGADTGWSVGALSGAFSLSMVLGGLGAAWTGRLVDRANGRAVMLAALAAGSVGLMVAARARSLEVFVLERRGRGRRRRKARRNTR